MRKSSHVLLCVFVIRTSIPSTAMADEKKTVVGDKIFTVSDIVTLDIGDCVETDPCEHDEVTITNLAGQRFKTSMFEEDIWSIVQAKQASKDELWLKHHKSVVEHVKDTAGKEDIANPIPPPWTFRCEPLPRKPRGRNHKGKAMKNKKQKGFECVMETVR